MKVVIVTNRKLTMATYTKFTNGYLCDEGNLTYGELYIDNFTRRIVEKPLDGLVSNVVDLKGLILAPGFIDIQNNGVYGVNFSHSTSKELYQDAMTKYVATGVTATCPTVTSNFPDVYQKVLPLYKKSYSTEQCDSLGAHLEGPFISLNKKGCHPTETFVDAKEGNSKLQAIYGDLSNVCIITAAPEIDGVLELIPEIKQQNITFSIGHTLADHATGVKAVENGATMITHLYNAMPQPHHREAGIVGLITTPDIETPYFGLICDNIHLDPAMVSLAYKANPEKTVLVTDAMHMLGLPDGIYKWDNQVLVKQGVRVVLQGTDTLAGAATTLPECVRNLMKWANISLQDAVKTVTNNAANSIGMQEERGYLNVGCAADFVVLDSHGYVQTVYKAGNPIKSSDIQQPQLQAVL